MFSNTFSTFISLYDVITRNQLKKNKQKQKKKTIDINKNLKLDSFFSRANNKAITHLSSLLYDSHFTHTHTHTYQSRIHYY